ncbi:MAG: butyrate kinase [Sphaerochaetaceae bacterium]
MRALVINPGAVATKISIFEEEVEVFRTSIPHSDSDLRQFDRIIDQKAYRMGLAREALRSSGFSSFDAICSRGGLLAHIPSGTYLINEAAIADVLDPPYGEHASNLGILMAHQLSIEYNCPACFVDPVSTDELCPLARYSGFAPMQRESFFHALNQKSMARKAAEILGRRYEDLNLIVVHMGGGVSVAAHRKGLVIDNYNVKDDGSFSMDRAGALPVNAVINYCFSGLTKAQVKKTLGYEAGVYSYLGTRSFMEVEQRAKEDPKAREVMEALVYQHAKDIGAMAAVLKFKVDAIVLTGGMANSQLLCYSICEYVGSIARIIILPGESEMTALCQGALRMLRGEGTRVYPSGEINETSR